MTTSGLLADRLQGIENSPTLALASKAKALAQAGKRVVDFTAGEPDFPTPSAIRQAAIRAIEAHRTKYTAVAGIPELRQAIAADLNRHLGTSYQPDQIVVTCGAKHALFSLFQVLCQPGDEVLVLSPYWVSYPPLVQLAGAKAVMVPTSEADGFQPDVELIRDALSSRTKAIILNSPGNPTGAVFARERLEAVARLTLQHHLWIVSDEIYDRLVFPPSRHWSIVQVHPAATSQTIVVAGVSKTYSMTGWRIGYAAGPKPLIEAMTTLQSHSTSNPTSISQYAALAALTQDHPETGTMLKEFQERRDRLIEGLSRLPGLSCATPQGAFYAWCNVSRLRQSASTIASRWLDEALVATVPGEGFGSSEHIRLSFATSMETIDEGLERLKQWLNTG